MKLVKTGMQIHFLANGDKFFTTPERLPQRIIRRQQERRLKKQHQQALAMQ